MQDLFERAGGEKQLRNLCKHVVSMHLTKYKPVSQKSDNNGQNPIEKFTRPTRCTEVHSKAITEKSVT